VKAIEQDVLQHLAAWLAGGERAWLCTIVGTIGSSPRPVGSLLACNVRGEQVGSLSGGCVEEDLLARLEAGELAVSGPQLIEYGVTAEENERLGLPCGGRLHVLVQALDSADLVWLQGVNAAIENRRCIRRHLDLATGATTLESTAEYRALEFDDQRLGQSFGPSQRMLLVGAGQLSQSLAELGLAMDYEVVVTDPRQRMLAQWEGPPVRLVDGMPDDAVRALADDPHSVIITLTHDPRIDDMALMEALESRAWYVGALGSARTTEKRLERLRALEVPPEALARLHAPVGIAIGSKTPIEIAISIMAELTQLSRARERAG
jgi:xanthine dehydrogenase accessory factor